MAPLVELAQRPRTARPVPLGHAPAVPGTGGLYRQGAPHHRHATPGGGFCHHAPGNRDRHPGAGDARGCGAPGQGVQPLLQQPAGGDGSHFHLERGGPPDCGQQQVRGGARGAQFRGNRLREGRRPGDPHGWGGLTLIDLHGPQEGCSPWAGRAAFRADKEMYATACSLGGRHPVVIAGDTNVYMDATSNPATEHFHAGWEACGFRRATAGGEEDMTPTLHPSRHRVDTFLVNEPLLLWSLRESVWARGMAHPQVIGSDHPPVCLALPGLLNAAGRAAMPSPYSHTEGRLLTYDAKAAPVQHYLWAAVTAAQDEPPWRPGLVLQSSTPTDPCPRRRWTRCSNTSTRRMTP